MSDDENTDPWNGKSAHEIAVDANCKRTNPVAAPHCSADILRLEEALKAALPLAERAHGSIGRAYDGEGGGAPSCLALMEIAVRNLRAANDAARYARHSLHKHPPQ